MSNWITLISYSISLDQTDKKILKMLLNQTKLNPTVFLMRPLIFILKINSKIEIFLLFKKIDLILYTRKMFRLDQESPTILYGLPNPR